MATTPALGEFEQVVLLAILRLGEDAYGVTIRREIATCTEREPAPGALYRLSIGSRRRGSCHPLTVIHP